MVAVQIRLIMKTLAVFLVVVNNQANKYLTGSPINSLYGIYSWLGLYSVAYLNIFFN